MLVPFACMKNCNNPLAMIGFVAFSLLLPSLASGVNDFCYTMSSNPDPNGNYQDVHTLIRPATVFPPEHSLVDTLDCVNAGDPYPHLGFEKDYAAPGTSGKCPASSTAGEAFYAYQRNRGSGALDRYSSVSLWSRALFIVSTPRSNTDMIHNTHNPFHNYSS